MLRRRQARKHINPGKWFHDLSLPCGFPQVKDSVPVRKMICCLPRSMWAVTKGIFLFVGNSCIFAMVLHGVEPAIWKDERIDHINWQIMLGFWEKRPWDYADFNTQHRNLGMTMDLLRYFRVDSLLLQQHRTKVARRESTFRLSVQQWQQGHNLHQRSEQPRVQLSCAWML